MAKELKIIVACGSGVATSTIAVGAVKEILEETGVKATIYKCTLAEVPGKQNGMDLVLTTANYRKPLEVPHMSVFGLVSGVNKDKTAADLASLLKKLATE